MTDQEAFLAAIQRARGDEVLRQVYADWLDEHDQPDEANRQRRAVEAIQWLKDVANNGGNHCEENYGDGSRGNPETREVEETDIVEKWVNITFDMVVDAGTDYVESHMLDGYWGGFTQTGDERLRDRFGGSEELAKYWECWELVTGKQRPAHDPNAERWENHHNPFSCSC